MGSGAAMAAASACLQVVATMVQMFFGGFLVSLGQQQLSGVLLLVINPKSVGLVYWNSTAEVTN